MVNNENFLLKEIPNFHPILQQYERIDFFKSIKRRIFEGYWVGGRWCPPELYYHVNLSTIQFLGGGRKVAGIGRPWFRDIEWEMSFVYTEACGFSGFMDDPEYTCLRDAAILTKEQIYEEYCVDYKKNIIQKNYKSLFKADGTLKRYMPAREYLYRTDMSSSFGKAMYLNSAKNVLQMTGRGLGKDLDSNTLLWGEHGQFPIKDVKIGDRIYGADGKLTTVVDRIDYFDQMQYEVKLSDGRSVECGGGHLWGVWYKKHSNSKSWWEYSVKSLDDLKVDYLKGDRKDSKYFIQLCSPIECAEKILPLDPYYFGLWLGDGNSHNAGITSVDKEITDYIYEFAKLHDVNVCLNQNKSKSCPTYNLSSKVQGNNFSNPVFSALKSLNVLNNKHIPAIYLQGSVSQRLALLQGLMDSDGSPCGNRLGEFTSSIATLHEDFLYLLNSLGIRRKVKYRFPKCNGVVGKRSMRVTLHTELPIFRLTRKLEIFSKGTPSKYSTTNIDKSAIRSITPTKVKHSVCIAVDNENKLFLAGNDCIVTHNSYLASSFIQHNLLTDGSRDYDEYLIGRKEKKFTSLSQTLVGAIEAKYSSDLLSKVKFSLDHLPGEVTIKIKGDDKTFLSPLLPELIGSWEPGAKSPIRDALSGSSIIHRTFMDNPLAANGTRPTRAFLEEVGFINSIQEILGAVEATQPNKQSNKYLPIWMLGTGGYTTTGTALWLKEIFYNPEAYDCISFEDTWENKGKIGYFISALKGQNDFKEGPNLISNEDKALNVINQAREKAKKSNNKVKILTEIINQPLTPSEVFMTINGNFFPVEDLRTALERLESSIAISDQSYKFEFQIVDGRVISKISDKRLIREFPLKKGIDMDAPVEVWELPQRNSSGDIYAGRYIGGWDPVDVDGNDDNTQSLQSSWILDTWTDRIVAEYTARTYLASDYYEQARRMFMFYNAQCNYESNLKGPYTYFLNKNSLHLLCETPESLSDKSLVKVSSIGNKSKGTRMNNTLISYGLEELLGYLEKQAYDKPEGVRNMDTIKSPALLRELIGYSPDINCDRISALLLLMIMRADRERITQMTHNREVKSKTSDPIWKRGYKRSFNKPWNGGFDL